MALLKAVLPFAQLGERRDGIIEAPARMRFRRGLYRRFFGAQKWIGCALVADRRWQCGLAAPALRFFAGLPRDQRAIVRFNRTRKTNVGERVFMAAKNAR